MGKKFPEEQLGILKLISVNEVGDSAALIMNLAEKTKKKPMFLSIFYSIFYSINDIQISGVLTRGY